MTWELWPDEWSRPLGVMPWLTECGGLSCHYRPQPKAVQWVKLIHIIKLCGLDALSIQQ